VRVKVDVFAQRNPVSERTLKVTEALLTYVALDKQGRKRALPDPDHIDPHAPCN
jgi:acyl-CoA thioesterase YciA